MIDIIWWLIAKSQGYIKYCLVGTVGFGIHLLTLWLLTEYAHFWYIGSAMLAIITASLNNYVLNYLWTFRDKKRNIQNKVAGYLQYLLSRGFTEGLYLVLLFMMVDLVGFHYMASAVIVQLLTAFMGYMIAVKWIWRRRKTSRNGEVVGEKEMA